MDETCLQHSLWGLNLGPQYSLHNFHIHDKVITIQWSEDKLAADHRPQFLPKPKSPCLFQLWHLLTTSNNSIKLDWRQPIDPVKWGKPCATISSLILSRFCRVAPEIELYHWNSEYLPAADVNQYACRKSQVVTFSMTTFVRGGWRKSHINVRYTLS